MYSHLRMQSVRLAIGLSLAALLMSLSPGALAAEPARSLAPLCFEPQDWSTPTDAWVVNKPTPDKWLLWRLGGEEAKRYTAGAVLRGPTTKQDRKTPEEGAPPLHTRITGLPNGRYDVKLKAARTLAVSLDGKTWRRYTHGLLAENVLVDSGVFELWVDDRYAHPSPGPCYYDQVILVPRLPVEDGLRNPRFRHTKAGQPAGWEVKGHLHYDAAEGFAHLASDPRQSLLVPKKRDRILLRQTVKLQPGHYLLKAVARANSMECILFARSLDYRGMGDRCQILSGPFGVPIGVSGEFHQVELPFFVEDADGATRDVTVGVCNQYSVPVHLEVDVREITLERLGDTKLKHHWAENLPMKAHHGLATLRENAQWERPGRVIFTDTYTGAQVWAMTQGERSYLRAQGVHSFSPDGKYLYVKQPGAILRTDGSARYTGFSRAYPNCEPWLAPWLQRRLPKGSDASDWVLAKPPTTTEIVLRHIPTGRTLDVPLPRKDGWALKLLPGKLSGISLQLAAHDTLVWVSDDGKRIGLSDSHGRRFRTFDVKSISADPAKDVFLWRNQVSWLYGFDGRWYVGYILNWAPFMGSCPQTPANTINPGQVWALPIAEDDARGLLRVVDGHQYWGMCMHPYKLEDGSLLHWWAATHRAMNARAGFRIRGNGYSTLALEDLATGRVEHFIGSYPCLDHIDFSHPDFVIPESLLYPYTLLLIDVKRRAMWPISSLQFHDYGPYTAGGGAGLQAQNPSPDATKVACVSSLLCRAKVVKGVRPKTALDVYNVIVRYPQPPTNVRLEGECLAWDRPHYHREIRGFNLYRAEQSGVGFRKVNKALITGLTHPLPAERPDGFYALTSVEHSGLESRRFSAELAVGRQGAPFRRFYEAEHAELAQPMAPVFDTLGCSNAYGVAVQDPDLLYRARLAKGLEGVGKLSVRVPEAGRCRILARVRAIDTRRPGRIAFRIGGRTVGGVAVDCHQWRWKALDNGPVDLPAGPQAITFASSTVGAALDNVLITSDLAFTPSGRGNTPEAPPSAPCDVRTVRPTPADDTIAPRTKPGQPPYAKLVWRPSTAAQGVHHYNVYRGRRPNVSAGAETLIGSPNGPAFFDCGLTPGAHFYRVTAVDAWGNESATSEPFMHRARPSSIRIQVDVHTPGIGAGDQVRFDASGSTCASGAITSLRWSFGDNTLASGKTVRHAYPKGGRYTVRLTVSAANGERASRDIPVYVHAPHIRALAADQTVLVEAETFSGQGKGVCQVLGGRVNASGCIVSYWEKDRGHWLEWPVTITKPGDYLILLKYCSGSTAVVRDLRVDDRFPDPACRKLVFPGTGGFSSGADNWAYQTVGGSSGKPLRVHLTAGRHTLRMANLGGGMGLDFIVLVRQP